MKAQEIMTRDPAFVTPEEPVSRAAEIMRELDVGIVPVVDDANGRTLRGVITDRDIAVRHVADHHTQDCRVADHMSERVLTAAPDDDVNAVMQRMKEEQVRRIPIVGDDNQLLGIIAQADVAVDIGPSDPNRVEEMLKGISKPAQPKR